MPPTTIDLEPSSTTGTSSGYDEWVSTTPDVAQHSYAALSTVDWKVKADLRRLAGLKPNWDAEGAFPVDPQIIEAARVLVSILPTHLKARARAPAVVPMRKGNLQFEWHDGPRTLELEIESPSTIHYLKWHSEAGIEDEDICPITDAETLAALLEWFVEG
jgi:hypothetical protein